MHDRFGRFIKGHTSWLKGTKGVFKHTEESRKKISKNNARYWKGKHVIITEETKEKLSKALKKNGHKPPILVGEKNHRWTEDNVQYIALHQWLRFNFGKANICENPACIDTNPKRYEWALIKDKKYERKRENFMMLCKKCHNLYDDVYKKIWKSRLSKKTI